jgi:hypothetical protein
MILAIGKLLSKKLFMSPIFIVGASRSGTSVLLQALGKHRHILNTPGEAPLLTSMGAIVHLFEYEHAITKEYYNQSLRFKKTYLYDYIRRLSFEIACGPHYGAKLLIREAINCPWQFFSKSKWAAKTFPNEKAAKGLLTLFPKSQFLYIVRNGVDVVTSTDKFKGFSGISFENNCKRWRDNIYTFGYLTNFDAALLLRHEDLVDNPYRFFSSVFNFLGEFNDPNASKFAASTIIHPLDQPTQNGVSVRESLRAREASFSDWSKEQKKIFRDVCAEAMKVAGYEIPF